MGSDAFRTRAALALAPTMVLALLGCGEEAAPEEAVDTTPIVGLMELPISLRNDAPAPSGALRIEINQTELRLESRPVLELERNGRLPESAYDDTGIPALATAVHAAPARSSVSITAHSMVQWGTTLRVIQTLVAAGYRSPLIAVRTPSATGASSAAWMPITEPRIVAAGRQPVDPAEFGSGNRPWSDFATSWRPAYDACRAGRYVDCDFPQEAAPLAEGGFLQVRLFTRGQAMQIEFQRAGEPPPERPAGGPALIEGVRAAAPAGAGEEVPPDPVMDATFSLRSDQAVLEDSPITGVVRPVCGAQPCQTVVEADDDTPTMRVVSLLGAAFPDGSTPPVLALRIPTPPAR